MNDRDNSTHQNPVDIETGKHRNARKPAAAIALALIITLALSVLAWTSWRQQRSEQWSGVPGSLTSVFLTNGQIYYGNLLETQAGYIKLGNVYYVQSFVQPDGQRNNKLVNRQANDWHSPPWLAIPVDKVVMVEPVGDDSQVAKLIRIDRERDKKISGQLP
jgi:hypothetical protein